VTIAASNLYVRQKWLTEKRSLELLALRKPLRYSLGGAVLIPMQPAASGLLPITVSRRIIYGA
jgi:hypothetical protein